MNLIKNIPVPVCGLILALLSLGNLLQDINPNIKYLFGGIGLIFLSLIILKLIFYSKTIKDDFKNPVIASSSGTFSMSLMILSTYLIQFDSTFAYSVWILGIALHILLIIYFTYHFVIHNFNISNVYPSYWIVYVGITMAAITSSVHEVTEIGFIFFAAGFISMIVTLPLIIYRYIRYPQIPDMNKPLICIFTALFSILITGYINSAQTVSSEFLIAMYAIACIFYMLSFYKLVEYRNLKFYPSFSAFTFPFVISAVASKRVMMNLQHNSILSFIVTVQTTIALVVVFYVISEYLKFFKNSEKSRNQST